MTPVQIKFLLELQDLLQIAIANGTSAEECQALVTVAKTHLIEFILDQTNNEQRNK